MKPSKIAASIRDRLFDRFWARVKYSGYANVRMHVENRVFDRLFFHLNDHIFVNIQSRING